MDDIKELYELNWQKALGALNSVNNAITVLIISYITIAIPITYSIATDFGTKTVNWALLADVMYYLGMALQPAIILIIYFYIAKYREYREGYKIYLVRSLIKNYHQQKTVTLLEPDDKVLLGYIDSIIYPEDAEIKRIFLRIRHGFCEITLLNLIKNYIKIFFAFLKKY